MEPSPTHGHRRRSRPQPSALDAFLAGLQRRARVLALVQCGDASGAEAALARASERACSDLPDAPMAEWPRRFWARLLAMPELRQAGDHPDWPALHGLSAGPRAALLLRLVAGLDGADIARVLGVSEGAAKLALARAVRALPGDGEAALARLKADLDAAVAGATVAAPQRPPAVPLRTDRVRPRRGSHGHRRGRVRVLLQLALAAVVVALAASFLWPAGEPALAPGESRPIPLAQPASLTPASAAVASPDFEAALAPERQALARDLAFYAWLAAQGEAGADD
ncbi:MAG: sigma factor-like helix-turn-helix DNA-binding protein [Lysobacteraceae bacterium]